MRQNEPSNKSVFLSLMRSLTIRDRFMLINMFLFGLVGGTLLCRSFSRQGSWLSYLIGGLFIAVGAYRFYQFYRAFLERKEAQSPMSGEPSQ